MGVINKINRITVLFSKHRVPPRPKQTSSKELKMMDDGRILGIHGYCHDGAAIGAADTFLD